MWSIYLSNKKKSLEHVQEKKKRFVTSLEYGEKCKITSFSVLHRNVYIGLHKYVFLWTKNNNFTNLKKKNSKPQVPSSKPSEVKGENAPCDHFLLSFQRERRHECSAPSSGSVPSFCSPGGSATHLEEGDTSFVICTKGLYGLAGALAWSIFYQTLKFTLWFDAC